MQDEHIDAPPVPLVPRQRGVPPSSPPPAPPLPVEPPEASRPPSRRRPMLLAAILFLALLLGAIAGVVVYAPGSEPRAGPAAAAATPATTPITLTPYEKMVAALAGQAAALLRGDEQGWLAAVDAGRPKLRAQYRMMYRSLRGLRVSQFEYHPGIRARGQGRAATFTVGISLCFSLGSCSTAIAPAIRQTLTMAPVRGRYVITRLAPAADAGDLQPMPWEWGTLVFAQGRRVTVAATPAEAGHLREVVVLADKAAAVTDPVGALVGNPQPRYRVFLADDNAWRAWYGGETDRTTIGLEVPLNRAGADVVVRMSELADRDDLARTLQHEMGHVVTIGGSPQRGDLFAENEWLSEGVAEYVEWSPRGAAASNRRLSVRLALHGAHPPRSIVAKPLGDDAGDRAIDAFYGLGHYAVDCMAQLYGRPRMFDFVRLRLRVGESLDVASRRAYGKPFQQVDNACVGWIRQHA